MIFRSILWRGLVRNLAARGIPMLEAVLLANAVYPGGAKKNMGDLPFRFPKPWVTRNRAATLVDRLLAMDPVDAQFYMHSFLEQIYGPHWYNETQDGPKSHTSSGYESDPLPQRRQSDYLSTLATLGLDESASQEDIDRRYRELAKEYHPDRHTSASPALQKLAAQKFVEIKAAYEKALAHRPRQTSGNEPVPPPEKPTQPQGRTPPPAPSQKRDTGFSESRRQNAAPENSKPHVAPAKTTVAQPPEDISKNRQLIGGFLLVGALILVGLFASRSNRPQERTPERPPAENRFRDVTLRRRVEVIPPYVHRSPVMPQMPPVSIMPSVETSPPKSSPTEAGLERAIRTAHNQLLEDDYRNALAELEPWMADSLPDFIRNPDIWRNYLATLHDARSRKANALVGELGSLRFAIALHDVCLVRHFLMRHELSQGKINLAKEYFVDADDGYKKVITFASQCVQPAKLMATAMQNRGTIRVQLGLGTADGQYIEDAKKVFAEALAFCSEYLGTTDRRYKRVAEEIAKLQ